MSEVLLLEIDLSSHRSTGLFILIVDSQYDAPSEIIPTWILRNDLHDTCTKLSADCIYHLIVFVFLGLPKIQCTCVTLCRGVYICWSTQLHTYIHVHLLNKETWLSSKNLFQGENLLFIQIFFVMLTFLLFSNQISGQKSLTGANCLRGAPPALPPPGGRKPTKKHLHRHIHEHKA